MNFRCLPLGPVTVTVAPDFVKCKPRGSVMLTDLIEGSFRPAATMNDSLGCAAPTRDSERCEIVGAPWTIHSNVALLVVPAASETLTVTVEVPIRCGWPVILPVEPLMVRPIGNPGAV